MSTEGKFQQSQPGAWNFSCNFVKLWLREWAGKEREEREGKEITSMKPFRVYELWDLRTVFSPGAGAGPLMFT